MPEPFVPLPGGLPTLLAWPSCDAAASPTPVPIRESSQRRAKGPAWEQLASVAAKYAFDHGLQHSVCHAHLDCDCDAEVFFEGLRLCGYASIEDLLSHRDNYLIGLHGTSIANIPSILRHGFDPARRNRQRLGPGEYFDIGDGSLATEFAAGLVIVAIIIRRNACTDSAASTGDWWAGTSTQVAVVNNPTSRRSAIDGWWLKISPSMAVVNNPVRKNFTYVLPVAVASQRPFRLNRTHSSRGGSVTDFASAAGNGTKPKI